jgi:hypothetical protein
MRFMMLVKASAESEAGVLPSRELIAEMGRFNEQLLKAGVLLAADGLHASSKGARVRFSRTGKPAVIDGPFTETKELIAGFWLIQVKSREEAIEWASRVPFEDGEVEVRQIMEPDEFPPEILPEDAAEREQAMRAALQRKAAGA